MITNNKEGTVIRLKKSNIKVNAVISALCNKLGLIPTKVVDQFKKQSLLVDNNLKRFYVLLKVTENDSFEVELLNPPLSEVIRPIKKEFPKLEDAIPQLRKYVDSINGGEKVLNQLIGSFKSFTS